MVVLVVVEVVVAVVVAVVVDDGAVAVVTSGEVDVCPQVKLSQGHPPGQLALMTFLFIYAIVNGLKAVVPHKDIPIV